MAWPWLVYIYIYILRSYARYAPGPRARELRGDLAESASSLEFDTRRATDVHTAADNAHRYQY